MFLTLYYMAATWLQSWRLRSISSKLSNFIADKMSIVFYNIGQDEPIGYPTTSLSSELCSNHSVARVADLLWHHGTQRGAAIVPYQNINLGPWISFPLTESNLVPFDFNNTAGNYAYLDENTSLHILLETGLQPMKDSHSILIEHFGLPIAWKVDTHLAVLIKSDLHNLTELILTSFMHETLTVNDCLPLIRIESVFIDGQPQPFESIRNHSRKDLISRSMRILSPNQWDKHIVGLRSFGILASQAFEFEYNKNRTEGKTGIVKPDLIPTKNISPTPTTAINDERDINCFKQHEQQIVVTASIIASSFHKRPSPKVTPKTSPLKIIPEIYFPEKLSINDDSNVDENDIQLLTNNSNGESIKIEDHQEISSESNLIDNKPVMLKKQMHDNEQSKSIVSASENCAIRPKLVRSKGSIVSSKPPNILVYADSILTRDSVISTLNSILEIDMYTIYPLTNQIVQNRAWINSTTLLVVCGYVPNDIGGILTEYFLIGGKMLSLCSDILHMILPSFRTHAEVREHELVQFSYGRWQNVKMMHHIFCYQPSPVRKHFSTDSDDQQSSGQSQSQKKIPTTTLVCPRSVEVIDQQDNKHSLHVQVLGTEETWNTPSLILATNDTNGGKAIFSQIHLEADPNLYEHDESKYGVLKGSNGARIEIFTDLLSTQLSLVVRTATTDKNQTIVSYTNAYFLGDHKLKFELLNKLKSIMLNENTLKAKRLTIKFCNRNEQPPIAASVLLPILINACPDNFSTIEYFDNLKSEKFGRLAIFVPVMDSSMDVVDQLTLEHGLVVIPYRQLSGSGRSGNKWLSPEGCTMFTIQLHIPIGSILGQRISLIQLIIGVAMIKALRSISGYENLDIRLKWPNDIYANGRVKIGGILTTCTMDAKMAICNIGCAINLFNSTPTTCVSDLVKDYNALHGVHLPTQLTYEKYLALIFTEFEILYNDVQSSDGLEYFYNLYQQLWLHSNEQVNVIDANGQGKLSEILGIDDYGYLLIKPINGQNCTTTVHPDGNSFDMLQGLIVSK